MGKPSSSAAESRMKALKALQKNDKFKGLFKTCSENGCKNSSTDMTFVGDMCKDCHTLKTYRERAKTQAKKDEKDPNFGAFS